MSFVETPKLVLARSQQAFDLTEDQQAFMDRVLTPMMTDMMRRMDARLTDITNVVNGRLGIGNPHNGTAPGTVVPFTDNLEGQWVTVSIDDPDDLSTAITFTHNLDVPVTTGGGSADPSLPNVRWPVVNFSLGGKDAPTTDPTSLIEDVFMVRADQMLPTLTLGAGGPTQFETTAHFQNFNPLLFNGGALPQLAQFTHRMDTDWDGGTVQMQFGWCANNSSTNNLVWQGGGTAFTDGEALDTARGTRQRVTDANQGTRRYNLTDRTPAITIANNPGPGDLINFEVLRDPTTGDDQLGVQAELLFVLVWFNRTRPAHNSLYFQQGDAVTADAIDLRVASELTPSTAHPLLVEVFFTRAAM